MGDLTKSDIEDIIDECLNDKRTLTDVKDKIKSISGCLSAYDHVIIEGKYCDFLIDRWLVESEDVIKASSSPNQLLGTIQAIKSLETLNDCCKLIGNSHCYNLLLSDFNTHYKLLKPLEKSCTHRFKKVCLNAVALQTDSITNEIVFFEECIELFKTSKDPSQVCSNIQIKDFLNGQDVCNDFRKFLSSLNKCEAGNRNYAEIKRRGSDLLKENNFYLAQGLKDTIQSYLKPATVSDTIIDGRATLEVSGKYIILSRILPEVECEPRFSIIEEVRFVHSDVIHIDADLLATIWHGKNIVVHSNSMIVSNNHVWDVSGKDGIANVAFEHCNKVISCLESAASDGNNGESGGNVMIVVENLKNGENLKIISKGGIGSNGHDGRKGQDGTPGKTISDSQFRVLYPPVSKFINSSKNDGLKKTHETAVQSIKSVDCLYRDGTKYGHFEAREEFEKGVIFEDSSKIDSLYFEITTNTDCKVQFSFFNKAFSFCQSFLLYKGSDGTEGKPGQQGGRGGIGGFGGEIDILVSKDGGSNISKYSVHGQPGTPGKRGASGNPGKCGLDKAYMDCTYTIFGQVWPKYFFLKENDNATLTVKYTSENSDGRVYAPHMDKYAEIQESRREFRINNSAQTDNTESSKQNLKENNSRKKTISLESILDCYRGNECIVSVLSDYVQNTRTALDGYSGEEVELEQRSEEVKVTQNISLECNSYEQVDWYQKLSILQLNPEENSSKDSDSLLIQFEQNPNNFLSLMNLACTRMSLKQLNVLWKMFDTSKGLVSNHLVKLKTQSMNSIFFCDKYKLAVLEDLESREFHAGAWSESTGSTENSSLIKNPLLTEKKSPGRVALFFVDDSLEKRDEALQICKHFSEDECFKSSLKTFLCEYGNSVTMPLKTKELMNKKLTYEQTKVAKLKKSLELFKSELEKPKNNNLHQMLIEGIVEDNGHKLVKFGLNIKSPKSNTDCRLLFKLFSHYCSILNTNFAWIGLEDNSGNVDADIKAAYFDCILHIGINSRCYRDLIALHFDINIMIYERNDTRELVLIHNHNDKSSKKLYLLKEGNSHSELEMEMESSQMIRDHIYRGKIYSKVLLHIDSLRKKNDFDDFINNAPFKTSCYSGISKSSRIINRVLNIMSQDYNVKLIKNAFQSPKEKVLLSTRLNKLKLEHSGNDNILHFMGLHFKSEVNIISAKELCFVINIILKCTSEDHLMPLVAWIVAAYPHNMWLVELSLLKLETYFKMILQPDRKARWREYLTKQNDSETLMLLYEKININQDSKLGIEHIEEVLSLVSNIPKAYIGLEQVGILEWRYHLKDRYWVYKIMAATCYWSEEEIKVVSYHLLCLENKTGTQFCNKIVSLIDSHKHNITESDKAAIEMTLRFLTGDEICIDNKLLEIFYENQIRDWPNLLKESLNDNNYRTVKQLIDLIKSNDNTSELILSKLDHIVESLNEINIIVDVLKKTINDESKLNEWVGIVMDRLKIESSQKQKEVQQVPIFEKYTGIIEQQVPIFEKYTGIIEQLFNHKDTKDFSGSGSGNDIGEREVFNINKECLNYIVVASVIVSVDILLKKKLRETQTLTILTFLISDKNMLGQVATGEGKSLIVVSIAIIKVILTGHSVDIITSSNVLAQRDAEDYKKVYSLFNVGVGSNCSQNIEDRKKAYSNCRVVYGELASFQRDFLLDRFYGKNILGDRTFGLIIVDEVDSMLLDQSNSMLYLSHEIPGVDKLEPIFVFIWKWLNMPKHEEGNNLDISTLKDAIRFDIFGIVKKENISDLDKNLSDNQVFSTLQYLINEGVIDNQGYLLMESIDESKVTVQDRPNCIPENHFRYLLEKVVKRTKQLEVPNHLKHFVKAHLDDWVSSAATAIRLEPNVHYVVDVNRTPTNTSRSASIILLDHHTGTDMVNCHWDKGLHQFLELKHGCRLSLISLKAVFKSNLSYFKEYKYLNGLTGTLGTNQDRQMLKDMYSVEFVTIPTAKPTKLVINVPQVHYSTEAWLTALIDNAYKVSEKRSVLIVCETIKVVSLIEEKLKLFLSNSTNQRIVVSYKRDYELVNASKEKLLIAKPGQIIISTNLAGRGTDITLSDEVRENGGLHVCLTFLPSNSRIEEQAYGRVARNGDPGSSLLIIKSPTYVNSVSKIIDLKKERDGVENIRITSVKSHFETTIKVEEELFVKFTECYENLKKNIKAPDEDIELIFLQDCLDQWAFWLDCKSSSLPLNPIDKFTEKLSELCTIDFKKWPEHLKSPSRLLRLGMIYYKMKHYKLAISFFDQVIKKEPDFSEIAHYYRPLAKAKERDLDKDSIISDFQIARKLLKSRLDMLLLNAQIIDWLKVHNAAGTLQIDSFKEQQENIMRMYQVFMDSIDIVLGSGVDYHSEIKDIIHELNKSNVISYLTVKKDLCEKELQFLEEYGIAPKKMMGFLSGKDQIDVKSLKIACHLPSKELFWQELIQQNVLVNEQKFVFVDMTEVAIDDPLSRIINTIKVSVEDNLNNQVWIYENVMETYLVCRKHELVEKLGMRNYKSFKSKGIFQTNKRATMVNANEPCKFKHFNSISYKDLENVGICNNTTVDILGELQNRNVLIENKSDKKHFSLLLQNIDEIESIELIKCKAYSEDVKSLLKYHFSFGLAMNELSTFVQNNQNLLISFKKKPHKTVVNALIEHSILRSVVNPNSNYKIKLDELYRDNWGVEIMCRDDWGKLFLGLYDKEKAKLIISDLIAQKWLITSNIDPRNLIEPKYKLNTGKIKIKQSTLSKKLETECDSIKMILLNHSSKLTKKDEYESFLNTAVGLLYKVETPCFELKPLRGILQTFKQPVSEINLFILNGHDQLLQLGEKTWSWKMKRDIAIATLIGLAQVAVGSACLLMPVVKTGLDDLIHCVSCMFTGIFHWKDYFINKLMSLVLIFKSPLSKIFSSNFGKMTNISVQSFKNAGLKLIDGCKVSLQNMMSCSISELFNKVLSGVVKAFGCSVISYTVHNAVQNKIEHIGNQIIEMFDKHFDKAVLSHIVLTSAKRLYRILGEHQAKEEIANVCSNIGNIYQSSIKSVWNKTLNAIFGMFKVAQNLIKFGIPTNLTDAIDSGNLLFDLINKMTSLLKKNEYNAIIYPINHFFDILDTLIQKKINDAERPRSVDGMQPQLEDANLEDFSSDMFFQFKDCVKIEMIKLLNETVIIPLLHNINEWLTNTYLKVTNKTFYKLFTKKQRASIGECKGTNFTEELKVSEKSLKLKSYVDREYDNCLLHLLKTRKNNAVFAEMLIRNTEIDISCLDFCCSVIPAVLKKHGINVPNLEIIVESNGGKKMFKTDRVRSASLTIQISTDDDIVYNLKSNKVLVKGLLNAVVLGVLPNDPKIQTIAQNFLELILSFLDSSSNDEQFEENETLEGSSITSPENDCYQHSHPDGSWILNPTVDSDIREEKNAPKVTVTELLSDSVQNHIQKGFIVALYMLNKHIRKVQSHLKRPFNLMLDDFKESKYDIFLPTSNDLNMFHGRAVEYQLVMPFKVKGGKLADFILILKLVNQVKKIQPLAPYGPHICYQVEPVDEAKYMGLGLKGHVLLHKECSRDTLTIKDCHAAGDLIQPTGFKLSTKKKFDVLILQDSPMRCIEEYYINNPLWEIKSLQNLQNKQCIQAVVYDLVQSFASFKCIIVHMGTFLLEVFQEEDKITQHVTAVVNQVMGCFAHAKVIIFAIHLRKFTEERFNSKILRVNMLLKKYCESNGITYVETSRIIGPDDLESNGRDLNKKGYKKLAKCFKKTAYKYTY